MNRKRQILVLGDQLSRAFLNAALDAATPDKARILMVESRDLARRKPYHAKKLVLVWSAMRHYAESLRASGYEVDYVQTDAGFADALVAAFRASGAERLEMVTPRDRRTREAIASALAAGGVAHSFAPDPYWEVSPAEFRAWLESHPRPKMEDFYRMVRRRSGVLMTRDGKPVGGAWNFDKENRKSFPKAHRPTAPFTVEPDAITRDVMEVVRALPGLYGSVDGFNLPVTREDSLDALDYFVREHLPNFGTYEDAMSAGDAFGYHSVLSPVINLSLLAPQECVREAEEAYPRGAAPLNSVEGFVRQIMGWREFMYHMYENFDGDYHATNALNHTRPLPDFYWTGETRMHCLRTVVGRVLEHGYSHHIERLMVLGNFALLWGADPQELNHWFWSLYADAHEWVVTPNVVGMSQFADGGWIATKPYVSSGAYVNRMSDYCAACPYDPKQATGDDACPFTTLYWSFLMDHEASPLSGRMTQNLFGLRTKTPADRDAIRARKAVLLEMADEL